MLKETTHSPLEEIEKRIIVIMDYVIYFNC